MYRKIVDIKLLAFLVVFIFSASPCVADSFTSGLSAYNARNFSAAVIHFKKAANQGRAEAQFKLGVMYDLGLGVKRNYKEAVKWYRKAANQGYSEAQYNLGLMYTKGKGVTRDHKEARKWYRKAADQGHSKAKKAMAGSKSDITPKMKRVARAPASIQVQRAPVFAARMAIPAPTVIQKKRASVTPKMTIPAAPIVMQEKRAPVVAKMASRAPASSIQLNRKGVAQAPAVIEKQHSEAMMGRSAAPTVMQAQQKRAPVVAKMELPAPAPIHVKPVPISPKIETRALTINPPAGLDFYKVKLEADPVIKKPGAGKLIVKIGHPDYIPDISEGMVTAHKLIPALGETAKVTPVAPDFTIEPNQSVCMKIVPSGSEVVFILTPLKAGDFVVGANILLYDSADCAGAPVPKVVSNLKVKVQVNVVDRIKESFWEQLTSWVIGIIGLVFLLATLIFRKAIQKLFGIDVDPPQGG